MSRFFVGPPHFFCVVAGGRENWAVVLGGVLFFPGVLAGTFAHDRRSTNAYAGGPGIARGEATLR
jgi:hypothetical protein